MIKLTGIAGDTCFMNPDAVALIVRGKLNETPCTIVYTTAFDQNGKGLCEYVTESPEQVAAECVKGYYVGADNGLIEDLEASDTEH